MNASVPLISLPGGRLLIPADEVTFAAGGLPWQGLPPFGTALGKAVVERAAEGAPPA
ncbi:hypothetical protein [Streptomyces sp. NBC_00162]|uniref:hypothetical protein n=1 Tax=Streptomyces sp. NBC_00162 TaxID=2903629 RepID=UPI00214B53F6|nr:hypothetical protein [Streptomyces sp. NBC_00162]UUU37893.1 hypothetical protein JIW86_02780 [Streptomyces sp. NBC_00162]